MIGRFLQPPLFGLILVVLGACKQTPQPIDVVLDPNQPEAVIDAAQDLASYLRLLQQGKVVVREDGVATCRKDLVTIYVGGPVADPALGFQGHEWTRSDCRNDGVLVRTRGADLLAAQHVVYALLERFNVRFYHPEQEWLPKQALRLDWKKLATLERFVPDFRERATGAHFSHPVELYDPIMKPTDETNVYVKRWILWHLKNRHSESQWNAPLTDYALSRGFPTFGGLNLFEAQQGSTPLILVTDSREHNEARIVEAIEDQLGRYPNLDAFGLLFNASEFPDATPIDDREVVHYLTFIANYFAAHYPKVALTAMNHGTLTQPTEHYGVRYFDLPLLAPKNLGIKLHTLMFYDLFRPAPVYGNTNFNRMHQQLAANAAERRFYYFPEHSWWLTFDLPVPLYLPITMEARSYDIQRLRPFALSATRDRGLIAHQGFSSGQEWGYWQQDWCSARMAFDTRLTFEDCFTDFAEHSSSPKEVLAALREVTQLQVDTLLGDDPEFVRYLVGSDDQTEAGEAAGIRFHPLPPTPQQIQLWAEEEVTRWEQVSKPKLERWISVFGGHAALLEKKLKANDWVGQEIADGIAITSRRADHTRAIMESALALRRAKRNKDANEVSLARQLLEEAQAIRAQAAVLMGKREASYRYPLKWSIAGDEAGTPGAEPNGTQYTYRYLGRAHRLFYWTRPEGLMASLLDDPSVVRVDPRISLAGEAVSISIANFTNGEVVIDWGDGATSAQIEPHTYAAQGTHGVAVSAVGDLVVAYSDTLATVAERRVTRPQDFTVEEPEAAGLLSSLFPGLIVGSGTDSEGFMAFGPDVDGDGNADAKTVQRVKRNGNVSEPVDVDWPLVNSSTRQILARITLRQLRLDFSEPKDVLMYTNLATADIVRLLIQLAAFDEAGARKTIASLLGYQESELPEVLEATVRARVR